MFVAFQRGRTAGAVEDMLNVANQYSREILRAEFTAKREIELFDHIDKFEWSKDGIVLDLSREAIFSVPLYRDLRLSLLVAPEHNDFITSDDPVIFTNAFLFDEVGRPIVGKASRGLIVITPLSPRHVLMQYDADVYKTSSHDTVLTVDEKTVTELNNLQYRNALDKIYFRDRTKIKSSLRIFQSRTASSIRSSSKIQVEPLVGEGRKKGLMLMHHQSAPRYPKALKLLSIRKNAKRSQFSIGTAEVRRPEIAAAVKEFMRDPQAYRHLLPTQESLNRSNSKTAPKPEK